MSSSGNNSGGGPKSNPPPAEHPKPKSKPKTGKPKTPKGTVTPDIVTAAPTPRGSLDVPHDGPAATPDDNSLGVPPNASSAGSPTSIKTLSCSELAVKLDKTLVLLHDHGAFCTTLPGAGPQWDSSEVKRIWSRRAAHDDMFGTFRQAIAPRQWPEEFNNPASGGVLPKHHELHASLIASASDKFANHTKLDGGVHDFLLPKIGKILQLSAAAKKVRKQLETVDIHGQKPLEKDFRKCCDDFFHDLLDADGERFTMTERPLNLPRNPVCDALIGDKADGGDVFVKLSKLQDEFSLYLQQASDVSELPEFRMHGEDACSTNDSPGKRFVTCALDVRNTVEELRLGLFKVAALTAVKLERAIFKDWGAAENKNFKARMKKSPRTGTCDAFTFLKFDAPPCDRQLRKKILHHCGLARFSRTETVDPDKPTSRPEANDAAVFCDDVGRSVDPEVISDTMGAAAIISAILKMRNSDQARQPKPKLHPGRLRSSITTETCYDDLKLKSHVPILLPLLIHEYKRNATAYIPQGGCQLRIYLNAACRFQELLGIIKHIVFGILLEGTSVVVFGAWKEGVDTESRIFPTMIVDHNTVRYDLTLPEEAYQFACFVAWVHIVHGNVLKRLLTPDKIKKYVDSVAKDDCKWTATHQNPYARGGATAADNA